MWRGIKGIGCWIEVLFELNLFEWISSQMNRIFTCTIHNPSFWLNRFRASFKPTHRFMNRNMNPHSVFNFLYPPNNNSNSRSTSATIMKSYKDKVKWWRGRVPLILTPLQDMILYNQPKPASNQVNCLWLRSLVCRKRWNHWCRSIREFISHDL